MSRHLTDDSRELWLRRLAGAAFVCGVALVLIAPLIVTIGQGIFAPGARSAWAEYDRIAVLVQQSLLLCVGVVVLSVPLGTVVAVALQRAPIWGRQFLQGAVWVGVFVPLPVSAVAWQILLSSWLPNLSREPGTLAAWQPWQRGVLPATIVHAAAALPWVVIIISAALRTANRNLEDAARLDGGTSRIMRTVLWPQLRPALLLATFASAIVPLIEIAITDAMLVRTFAEETYTQLVSNPAGVAAAVAINLPVWFAASLVGLIVWLRLVPPANRLPLGPSAPASLLLLRPLPRIALGVLVWGVLSVGLFLPLFALIGRTFATGRYAGWVHIRRVFQLNSTTLIENLISAIGVGLLATAIALVLSWWAFRPKLSHRAARWRTIALGVLVTVTAVSPGPLIGLGLKKWIHRLLDLEDLLAAQWGTTNLPLRWLLYDGDTPLPGGWAVLVRYWPIALAIVAPVVRSVPRSLVETALLDHGRIWPAVGWPHCRAAASLAVVSVTALSLGEVSARKLVTPPQSRLYILDLFNQMHYGPEASVAAMALVQLGVIAIVLLLARRLLR